MMGAAHTGVVREAAAINRGERARQVLASRFWLDRRIAALLNDGILRDWIFTQPPPCISVIHRLTREVLTSRGDGGRTALLINWVSHYVADPLWINHAYLRDKQPTARLEDKDEFARFDNGIEREVENLIGRGEIFGEKIEPWDKGFWNSFWRVLAWTEKTKAAYHKTWARGGDYMSTTKRSILLCVKTFENYFRYLDAAESLSCQLEAQGLPPLRSIYCSDVEMRDGALSLAVAALMENPALGPDDVFVDYAKDADVILRRSHSPYIASEQGKVVVGGDPESIGFAVDHLIFERGLTFGAGPAENIHPNWPGCLLLTSDWTGEKLERELFTDQFAERVRKHRGYENFEIVYDPPKLPESAAQMRAQWIAAARQWEPRWREVARMPSLFPSDRDPVE